jgi:hypothetical protein
MGMELNQSPYKRTQIASAVWTSYCATILDHFSSASRAIPATANNEIDPRIGRLTNARNKAFI